MSWETKSEPKVKFLIVIEIMTKFSQEFLHTVCNEPK